MRGVNGGEQTEVHGRIQGRSAKEALSGDKTIQQIAARHDLHSNYVSQWKRKASEGLVGLVEKSAGGERHDLDAEFKKLHDKIGQLVVERDFLICLVGHNSNFWLCT